MRKIYFLILVVILIIFAGLIIYYNQHFLNSYEVFSLKENQIKEQLPNFKFLLVGDIMLDRKVELLLQKNGFAYPFEKIVKFLNQNNGVFGNLEGPVSENPKKFSLTAMEFAFDAKVIQPLVAANFKILSLANNHTLNMGNSGLEESKKLLEQASIDWVGDSWNCSQKLAIKEDLVFLAFNKTFSGCKDEEIIAIVKSVKSSAPDKFLIVNLHWGDEYKLKSNAIQRESAHKIIDAGADLIVGQHPHVVQEIERYENKLIFYSLGNFIFDQYFSQDVQEGLMLGLDFYSDKVIYKLFPIESSLSQPFLMAKEKAKTFLNALALRSSAELSDKIKQGIIEISKEKKVCFDKDCFFAELAVSPEERNRGLMFRKNLDSDKGMLFIFDQEDTYPFWMKNTLIPLDIIWLNENKEIVFIAENVQPCEKEICESIKPDQEAKYVLEINAGLSEKINLKIGDKLTF